MCRHLSGKILSSLALLTSQDDSENEAEPRNVKNMQPLIQPLCLEIGCFGKAWLSSFLFILWYYFYMKKFVFGFLCFCFWVLPVYSFTLKGGVTFTVESARKEAFADVEYSLPKNIIDANRIDPNFEDNKVLIKNGVKETGDRFITYYSDNSYSIVYKKNLYFEFYYKENGKIDSIGKRTGLICPAKSYKYNANGKLDSVTLNLSIKEAYIFSVDGQLYAHWIGNKAYNEKGRVILESYYLIKNNTQIIYF